MKISARAEGRPVLEVKYEGREWREIESRLKAMGLEKATSTNIFGEHRTGEFYRESTQALATIVRTTLTESDLRNLEWVDDVNAPVVMNARVNVSLFRVVPVNSVVLCNLPKFMTVAELSRLAQTFSRVLAVILNIATSEQTVTIATGLETEATR